MSDTRSTGEPVGEPAAGDPVVTRRHDDHRAGSLADADTAREAARTTATTDAAEQARSEEVWTPDRDADAGATGTRTAAARAAETRAAEDAPPLRDAETRAYPPDDTATSARAYPPDDSGDDYVPGSYSTRLYDEPAATTPAAVASTSPASTPASDAETVAVAPVAVAEPVEGSARQPIFVQAPEAPVARGNRAAAGAIGLLAAVVFAILYLAVGLGLGALLGVITADNLVEALLAALSSWSLWVPTAVFFLGFWLLGAIINRGRWGVWVVLGLLVGVAAYVGHIVGALFQAPFWTLTAREGADLAASQLLAPLAVAAFIIGRELSIWFGAWVARRGRRVTELNIEAQREYERTLEAGPKLYAS